MEDIPPPVQLHFGRNGFSHASSSNIYDWVNDVDNSRETRTLRLSTQDIHIDTITPAQKRWIRKQKEIKGIQFRPQNTDELMDYSEIAVIRARLS